MATITVTGTNDLERDRDAVQNALDAAVGDRAIDEIVLVGTFNFGFGWRPVPVGDLNVPVSYPRTSVVVRRGGLTIRGVTPEDVAPPVNPFGGSGKYERTRILGGGADYDSEGPFGMIQTGPFRVATESAEGPVVIRDLTFSHWRGQAILITACRGMEIKKCNFTLPVPGTMSGFDGMEEFEDMDLKFLRAVFALGPSCTGEFLATENICDVQLYSDKELDRLEQADNEQFLTCGRTNFSKITISHNRIKGNDDGVDVIFNNLDGTAPRAAICINYNFMELENRLQTNWPGHAGIICARNENASTEIVGNVVRVTGSGGSALFLTGDDFVVTDNELSLRTEWGRLFVHYAGIVLGWAAPMPFPEGLPRELGSCSNATIADNHLSGHATFGIVTNGAAHDNKIMHNALASLMCQDHRVALDPATSNNYVTVASPNDVLVAPGSSNVVVVEGP